MKNQSNTFDTVYAQALDMFERGLGVDQIVKAFPEHADELHDIFSIAMILGTTRDTLKPSKDSFTRALQKIHVQEKSTHFSFIETLLHAGAAIRVAIPAGVAILVVGIVLYERSTLLPQPAVSPTQVDQFHDASPTETSPQTDTMMFQQETLPSAGAGAQKRASTLSTMAPLDTTDVYAGDVAAVEAALAAEDGTVAETVNDPALGDTYNENDFVF